MKWAGGKTQLLSDLIPRAPKQYGRYIEPFFGGGALFFALKPSNAIISDSNPELINMYKQVADHVDEVILNLQKYENNEDMFYSVRSQDWTELPEIEAAARMLYLNHTCFNGLYRVNKKGQFNTPFGHYKNPNICDEKALRAASDALKNAVIICGDYLDVLEKNACEGDFIFLDPPYVPISKNADFKRYTKEQFGESDHQLLAQTVNSLADKGCNIILTNSNHPIVTDLYGEFEMTVVQTKRHVSCHGNSRKGEDVIVTIPGATNLNPVLNSGVNNYPPTRYMGSKRKLINSIWGAMERFSPTTALDLFSGSGIVSYMLKTQGVQVVSNDYMAMSAVFSKALIENNNVILSEDKARTLINPNTNNDGFVSSTFQGLYFTDAENKQIDDMRKNIADLDNEYERAIAMMALIRACIKKRPRGIFTYTGNRYDDGRKDLRKSLSDQFLEAVQIINKAVFDNKKNNQSINGNALEIDVLKPDLVYMDPPYYSKHSDNEYVRRYHFLEGLARDWNGVEIQQNTKTKKFKSYPTPFSTEQGAIEAFRTLFERYSESVIVVSYSSNSLPTRDEIVALLAEHKKHVDIIPIDHKYSFGNQRDAKTHRNSVTEYIFVGY